MNPTEKDVAMALKIEDDHYCGKHPTEVRLSTVIAQALASARKEGFEEGVEGSENCCVGIFPTPRSVEILKRAIRNLKGQV